MQGEAAVITARCWNPKCGLTIIVRAVAPRVCPWCNVANSEQLAKSRVSAMLTAPPTEEELLALERKNIVLPGPGANEQARPADQAGDANTAA